MGKWRFNLDRIFLIVYCTEMNKRYIVRHCSSEDKRWYEAHYSAGATSNPRLFSIDDYGKFLQFTDLLDQSGYNYIENEDDY
mgnify:CR=1 FL=1